MKRIKIILVVLLTLSLFGCNKDSNKDLLDVVKERGKLIICMEGTWAPWTYHDENDNLIGFDVEVGQYIADYLGVKAEFIEGEWDGLLAGVKSGRYDCLINGVDITDERKETCYFSDPYAFDHVALVVNANNNEIKTFEDLKGKVTTNTLSSSYAALAESYGATVEGVDDLATTIELVKANRVDATLNSYMTYIDYFNTTGSSAVKVACLSDDVTEIAIPVVKSERTLTLLAEINKAITQMQSDGTIEQLSMKYFNVDITKRD